MHHQKYSRKATVPLDVVLPLILANLGKNKARVDVAGTVVKVTGLRLQTFATKGCKCSACGLEATHFAIEANSEGAHSWHLNLWGYDAAGEEVLFTHDHTIDRADGGADNASNTTTMCSPCNAAKAVIHKQARDERNRNAAE